MFNHLLQNRNKNYRNCTIEILLKFALLRNYKKEI